MLCVFALVSILAADLSVAEGRLGAEGALAAENLSGRVASTDRQRGEGGNASVSLAAGSEGDVLLRAGREAILTPRTMALDVLLDRLSDAARSCALGPPPTGEVEEIAFSRALADWISRAADCLPHAPMPASGVVTRSFWRAVAPEAPPPGVVERVEALTLTFEATPFSTPPIWNFCQDIDATPGERPDLVMAGAECENRTDPCSMLTWGPRGATAGQGREIQWILKRLGESNRELLANAFGPEAEAMQRFLGLQLPPIGHCDGSSATEAFLCAVWVTPERRAVWSNALRQLGASPAARTAYRDVYALFEFDGYKLAEYRALWERMGLAPTELDLAFFYDRATHIGSPPSPVEEFASRLEACVDEEIDAMTRNAAARRCVARLHPHLGVPKDRLGRDMAYYRSGYPAEALSEKERDTWDRHIPIDAAVNLGLSDQRLAPPEAFEAIYAEPVDWPDGQDAHVTDAERSCQAAVWR